MIIARPADLLRDEIVAKVRAATGRDLLVAGHSSLSLQPSFGLRLRDLSLSGPPGRKGEPILRIARLDLGLQLSSLLERRIKIDRIVLHEPILDLSIDAQGRRSWERADAQPWAGIRTAQAASAVATDRAALPDDTDASGERMIVALEALDAADIRIENGAVRYRDARSGSAQDAEGINGRLGIDAPARALDFEASLAWRGEKIDIDGRLSRADALVAGQPARLTLGSAGVRGTASYEGAISVQPAFAADGALKAETNSARALASWLGARLPARSGFERATLEGKLEATGAAASLSDATFTLDGETATGALALDVSGAKPLVNANLTLSALDLNTYLASPASAGADGGRPAADPKSIEDLLNAPAAPRVKGFAQRGGWSEETFEAGDLGRIDLDARLAVGDIRFRKLVTGPGTVTLELKNHVLRAGFEDLQAYEGRGRGALKIDAAGEEPTIEISGALEGVSVRPLLRDTAAIDWLAGRGNATLALSSQGRNERAIIERLNGKAAFAVTDGAVVGWNVSQLIGALRRGSQSPREDRGSAGTEFRDLTGTVAISSGMAHNQDLLMTTSVARIRGAGTVNLPDRHIDYVLRPKLVVGAEGRGEPQQSAALEVPVTIQGSWDDPRISTDLGAVVSNPEQAIEAVKEIGKKLKGKKVEDVVKGLLGDEPGQSDRAKQLLNQFLKRQ